MIINVTPSNLDKQEFKPIQLWILQSIGADLCRAMYFLPLLDFFRFVTYYSRGSDNVDTWWSISLYSNLKYMPYM